MARDYSRGAALLLLSLLSAGAAAQVGAAQEEGGWIGIHVEGRALPDGSTRVMIVRVDSDGPAQRAGVRPFDVLLRLDGVDASQEALRELAGRLRPGAPVQLTVLRDNRERRIRVTAGRRPWAFEPDAMERLTASVDSARLEILRMMDSLLADSTWARVRTEMEAARRALHVEIEVIREFRATLEGAERTRDVMERIRSMRFARPLPPGEAPSARARATMGGETGPGERGRRDGRPGRGRTAASASEVGSGERGNPGGRAPPGARFRSPYLLGERFVAGAELREETRGGAGTDDARGRWLRVVRILEGSPADRAGLAPSDLIVGIGGEPVGDLRRFRIRLRHLHLMGHPEMEVVRGDTTLVVLLPR